jgi:hypothetical protein
MIKHKECRRWDAPTGQKRIRERIDNERSQIMSIFRKAVFYMFLTVLLTGLLGCENEGPMERVGKKVDKAVEDTSKAI